MRSQEFMPSKARLKFLNKMIILGPKTAILGPQFCRILVLGPHFWRSGGDLHIKSTLLCKCFKNQQLTLSSHSLGVRSDIGRLIYEYKF